MALVNQEKSAIGGVALECGKAADCLAGVAADDYRKNLVFECCLDGVPEFMKFATDDFVLVVFVKLFGLNRLYQLKFDILVLFEPVAAGKPLDRLRSEQGYLRTIAGLMAMSG